MKKNIFWLGIWSFGLIVLFCLGLRGWSGDRFVLVRLGVYFMPWLLGALVPALLVSLFAGRWWLAGVLALPVIIIGSWYAPLFLPRDPSAAENPSIRVMSYNIWSENDDLASAAAVIRRENPDILLLQEGYPHQLGALKKELSDLYPEEQITYDPRIMQAVFSRYPLEPVKSLREKGQAQKVVVLTPYGPVTVFNVHPLRTWGWQHRYNQIVALLENEVLALTGPVILGGDFNVTEQTELYRRITRHLRNTHEEGGRGFGFTFPSSDRRFGGRLPLFPLVRIDHIFYSSHFTLLSSTTIPDSGGSDHLPIVAVFHLLDLQK
jgi:vancomycin resistance protein VanJ